MGGTWIGLFSFIYACGINGCVTASKFAYFCFAEADEKGTYTPEIVYGSNKKKESFAVLETMDHFYAIRKLLFKIELLDKRNGAELKALVPSCVSPKDLFLSPNFIPLGRLMK